MTDAVSFTTRFAGGLREPPAHLAQVVLHAAAPPPVATLLWR